ncbi:GDP-mannose mannosyl hydrolase [subsurface metagenome]
MREGGRKLNSAQNVHSLKDLTLRQYNRIKALVPLVGVELIVHKDNKMLICKRKVGPGKGKWALPGGRVQKDETLQHAVLRKAKEELGIEVKIDKQLQVNEAFFPGVYHYVVIEYLVSPVDDKPIQLDMQHSEYKWVESPDELFEARAKAQVLASGVLR